MISRDLNNRSDYQFDIQNDLPDLILNDNGDILTCNIPKYVPLFSASTSLISPPIVSNGINIILEGECPIIASPYQYAHLEFILSYNSEFVHDGARNSDILYKFESTDLDGWFIEAQSIYDMPGTGYTAAYYYNRYRVKYIATGLTLDLSRSIYFYYRARYATLTNNELTLSNDYSAFNGQILDMRESYFSNTGSSQYNQIVVDLLPQITDVWTNPWPSSKNIHYELYIGKYGNASYYQNTGDYEIYRNSASNPSGFYYFDDLNVVGFGEDGMPSSKEWNKAFFITDELDTEKALFVVYKAKWDTGDTGWIAQSLNLYDYVSNQPAKYFYPSSIHTVRANQFNERYNMHVIIGNSPNLSDYFDGGDTEDFTKILPTFPGLVEYSFSGTSTDRNRFFYYADGIVRNPTANGFDNTLDLKIVYKCSQSYSDEEKIFVFWRVQYEYISSSSSFSSSCSSCSSSSSVSSSSNSSSSISSSSLSSSSLSSSSYSSSSNSSSSLSSESMSSSSSGEFWGEGYYCCDVYTKNYPSPGDRCNPGALTNTECLYLGDETQIGVCIDHPTDPLVSIIPSAFWGADSACGGAC